MAFDALEVAIQLNNFGAYLQREGRAQEARPVLARCLDIRTRDLGPMHIKTAVTATSPPSSPSSDPAGGSKGNAPAFSTQAKPTASASEASSARR